MSAGTAAGLVLLLLQGAAGPALAQDAAGLRPVIGPDGEAGTDPGQIPANQADPYDEVDGGPAPRDDRTAPNFKKPRPMPDKRKLYPGRRKELRRTLPPLEPYQTAPRQIRVAPADAGPPPPPYAVPKQIVRKQRPKLEDNPYAPLGIDMGSIRVLPFVEFAGGYDTNANSSSTAPKGSSLARIDAGFTAFSLWSRHEFRADVKGGFVRYFADRNANRPDGSARATLRLDVDRTTQLNFELRGTLTTQRPGSPELTAAVVGRPAVISYGASTGVTKTFGRLETTAAVQADRTEFENGKLTNGNTVALSRDNFTAYGLRGRIAYEITPGIKPFVEAVVDTRKRDQPVDSNGYARNSTGVLARLGTSFELTRTLSGEVSGGYAKRNYADPRLTSLGGPTLDASLIWSATPLTTVTFKAQTLLNESTIAGAAGAISRRGSVEINHALLRNLNLGASAVWQNNNYRGIALTENLYEGTLKAEYSLSRSVVVKGSFTHTRLKSSQPGSDFTANTFLLGLRLQR
ncbi:MAG: outer membrane beta-barrel protein [Beijerinckiaceae bacterium]